MPKYTVVAILSADTSQEVEAASPQEALEKAEITAPGLCHQCCRRVQVGDPYKVMVLDEAGEEVPGVGWDDSADD